MLPSERIDLMRNSDLEIFDMAAGELRRLYLAERVHNFEQSGLSWHAQSPRNRSGIASFPFLGPVESAVSEAIHDVQTVAGGVTV